MSTTQKAWVVGLAVLALVLMAFAGRESYHRKTEKQLTQALTQYKLEAEVSTTQARSLKFQVQQLTATLKEKVEEFKMALHHEAVTHTEQRPDGTVITDTRMVSDMDKESSRRQLEQAASLMLTLQEERDTARSQLKAVQQEVATLSQELESQEVNESKAAPRLALLAGWQFSSTAATVNPWDKARLGAGLPWGPLTVGVDCAPLSILNGSGVAGLDPQLRVELRL